MAATQVQAQSTPADSNIKAALYDIERAEGQIKSLTPSRTANINRMQRTLGMTEQRLQASPNKSDPSWQDASARLEKLKAALASLASGGAPAASAPAPQKPAASQQTQPQAPAAGKAAPPPATAAADPNIDRAVREMDLLERQIRGQRSVTQRSAHRNLTELYRIGKGLAAANRSHPTWQAAATKYGQLKGGILDMNARVLDAEYRKIADRIAKMSPTQYMVANDVGQVRKMLAGVYGAATGLGSPEHPSLKALIANIEKTGDAFEERVKTAAVEREKHGDVNGKLAQIKERVYRVKVPELNSYPATEEQILAYAKGIEAVREHIATDGAYLASIEGKVPMTVEQRNVFNNAKSQVQFAKPKGIDRSMSIATQTMDRWATDQESIIEFFEKTDPKDRNHQANRLLAKGKYQEGLARLADVQKAIATVAVYDKAMKRTDAPDRAAQAARADAALARFKEKYRMALTTIRMPEARSTSDDLHKVVAEVFARPKYGYKAERVVINSDVKQISNESGSIRHGTTSSTVTVYKYKWDEFQATTAEEEDGVYYMYANTFRFYHSGDSTTPVNRWILSKRFQSSQILKENIGK